MCSTNFPRLLVFFLALQLIRCETSNVRRRRGLPFLFDVPNIVQSLLQKQTELVQCLTDSNKATTLKNYLNAITAQLFNPPLIYNNKKYVISKFPYKDSFDANNYCIALGGYLAEIDDNNEYQAAQHYLSITSGADIVLIGGTDAAQEGTWKFPRTGTLVPVLDWAQGQPDDLGNEDCLDIWKSKGGKMGDLPCGFRSELDRFMCELPNDF
nr:perlucin-like protein [Biomphalaria glabrata]